MFCNTGALAYFPTISIRSASRIGISRPAFLSQAKITPLPVSMRNRSAPQSLITNCPLPVRRVSIHCWRGSPEPVEGWALVWYSALVSIILLPLTARVRPGCRITRRHRSVPHRSHAPTRGRSACCPQCHAPERGSLGRGVGYIYHSDEWGVMAPPRIHRHDHRHLPQYKARMFV